MNKKQAALEMRLALQYFAATLTNESSMTAIATVFPQYKPEREYDTGEVFSYGVNAVGDPQLYTVLQSHKSAGEWPPDATPGLYKPVGVTAEGIPVWVQPLGASDAYRLGDTVSHGGVIWTSSVDKNVWEPGIYGWEV